MFDTGVLQEYARGVQDYAKGVGEHARGVGEYAKAVPDRWSPPQRVWSAPRWRDYARAMPERLSPTLTYKVELPDQNWWKFLMAGIGLGFAASWFLVPRTGRRNRADVRDRIAHLFNLTARELPDAAGRKTEYMGGKVTGLAHKARGLAHLNGGEEPPDLDQFIAHKVETEVFGRPDVPKGAINVDSVDGVVTVRGTVESADVTRRIVKYIEGVEGVRDVVNLMKTRDESPLASGDRRG